MNFKTTAAPVLFDVEFRLQWLLANGNPLSRLDAVVDWDYQPVLPPSHSNIGTVMAGGTKK